MEKENALPANVGTPPPPALLKMGTGRKSSVKKVRFSFDNDITPPMESPIRLNRDILGDEDPSNLRHSLVGGGRRSSIGTSDSPLHFPSQEELLRGNRASVPMASPSDSRQSTGSSINGVLSSMLNSFEASAAVPARNRSIWDTPSSSAKKPSKSSGVVPVVPLGLGASPAARIENAKTPSRMSAVDTPGKAEQRMFGFQVVLGTTQSADPAILPSEEVGGSPIIVPLQDDPEVLSVASSHVARRRMTDSEPVTTSRRRRRLSHLDDMEHELLNASSPERFRTPHVAEPKTVGEYLIRQGIDIHALMTESLPDTKTSEDSSRDASSGSKLDQVLTQASLSREATLEAAIDHVKQLIREERLAIKSLDVKNLLGERMTDLQWKSTQSAILKELLEIEVIENQIKNLVQLEPALDALAEDLSRKLDTVAEIQSDTISLTQSVTAMKKELDSEFRILFTTDSAGNPERIKSDAERRLYELDAFVWSKEGAIREAIEEITEIEATMVQKEKSFTEGFAQLRQFYLDNGWNVICELDDSIVLVYAVCHILVFEKARNDSSFWRLDRIVPAKMDPGMPPFYAPNLLSNQVKFNSQLVLGQLALFNNLHVAFEFEGEIFHDLMAAAVTALCEWTDLREMLGKCLPSAESRATINSNLQIEISLVVMNKSLGDSVEVPMLVKLLWFDSLFGGDTRVRFDNFSFIASDSMLAYFPFVKSQIDERLALINPSDVLSPSLLNDIVLAVTSVLLNAQLSSPSYA